MTTAMLALGRREGQVRTRPACSPSHPATTTCRRCPECQPDDQVIVAAMVPRDLLPACRAPPIDEAGMTRDRMNDVKRPRDRIGDDKMMEDKEIFVPITRAERYPHEDAFDPKDGAAIERLDTDRVSVNHNHVVVGTVTLTVHGPDPLDPYGYDFDLSPDAARDLARLLTEAAADAAGSEVSG